MANKGYPGANEGSRHESGEREPKAAGSDRSGEKSGKKIIGIAMGKADATGRSNGSKERGEYNTGRSESVCYTHQKKGY